MNERFLEMLNHAYEPGQFVDFLGITIEDLIEAFPEEFAEAEEDLKEMVDFREEEYTDGED